MRERNCEVGPARPKGRGPLSPLWRKPAVRVLPVVPAAWNQPVAPMALPADRDLLAQPAAFILPAPALFSD